MNYYFAAFKRYAEFTGRSGRRDFWYFYLFNVLVSMGLMACSMTMSALHHPLLSLPFSLLSLAYSFGQMIPHLAAAVRRCHDTGRSGWVMLIPIYNLVVLCTEGVKGPNDFGPDPKDEIYVSAAEMAKAA